MKRNDPIISVVIPCFNEAENIPLMISALEEVLKPWDYEVVLVDDGSTDNSPKVYRQLGQINQRIKFLLFSRNFGHQAALKAGIDYSCGGAVVIIDADLQQPPAWIPLMIEKCQQGADIVEGFEHAYIDYKIEERQNGNTPYPFTKMIGLASSGMTSMSVKPLRVAMITGIGVSLLAFLYALYAVFASFYDNQTVPGWTSTIISVLFMAGIQLIVLGIMGEYIGKLFMENKRRPVNLVADTNITNDGPEKENPPTNLKNPKGKEVCGDLA